MQGLCPIDPQGFDFDEDIALTENEISLVEEHVLWCSVLVVDKFGPLRHDCVILYQKKISYRYN